MEQNFIAIWGVYDSLCDPEFLGMHPVDSSDTMQTVSEMMESYDVIVIRKVSQPEFPFQLEGDF